ncbi:DUF1007 family protein [Methylobacterium oxalidis]|uniref:ABC transporter substrate-binding protein n=1 Tax=Methylobacterium oxalidis TaxID=944322 RepID=A0A512J7Z5_9HYPH|nr:DUF1007 family protein [Methylobacterium oxalidis]GEP05999.1 ABC transporter substrate-binding protein [Methylobacterium oxalidis]GJE32337.1 hypothetical protein LDDCCGHA_2523 [Methylobacterium oxalidis]GLS65717.1 ABC transporter substrate-binding protein [Methylobacterium oxalidis]
MPTASHRAIRLAALLAAGLPAAGIGLAAPAEAHPHVWVVAKAEIDYGDGGRVTGIRHAWTFDAAYSAFITQGLDRNGDGTLSADELSGLAAENTANLSEFGYFTKLKVAGKEQVFGDPAEPRMAMEGGALTLSFLLPLKSPAPQGRGVVALEVYDPTYFVAFSLAEGADAARLAGAPGGCAATVTRPKAEAKTAEAAKPGMTEAFFEALTAASNYGVQFANRVIVACP